MLGCKARHSGLHGPGHDVDLSVPVAGVLVDEDAAEAQHENASIPETHAAVEIFAAALAGALTLAVGILVADGLEVLTA